MAVHAKDAAAILCVIEHAHRRGMKLPSDVVWIWDDSDPSIVSAAAIVVSPEEKVFNPFMNIETAHGLPLTPLRTIMSYHHSLHERDTTSNVVRFCSCFYVTSLVDVAFNN